MNKRIPVLLVTGFLGSGKTTFLNWLIHTHPDKKISLILNEFGDVKLESQFIEQNSGGEVAELANGCMCCVAKSDIPRVIDLILERSPQTQYIIIEASGLSDPDPIHDALRSRGVSEKVTLSSVLCIVDAVNFENTRSDHSIVMSQIGDADVIILSKVKEAGEETTQRVKNFIESIGVNTKVILWDDDLDPDLFLMSDEHLKDRIVNRSEDQHDHEHEQYDEYWFSTEHQMDLDLFKDAMNSLPSNIVRSKGYVFSNNKKYMLQYVGGKLEITGSEWGDENPDTKVLFLGKGLDKDEIEGKMLSCVMDQTV